MAPRDALGLPAASPRPRAGAGCHHLAVAGFDLLLRGGTVIDGTGGPARRADVGVLGDRILAVGDLGVVDPNEVGLVLDVAGRVVVARASSTRTGTPTGPCSSTGRW